MDLPDDIEWDFYDCGLMSTGASDRKKRRLHTSLTAHYGGPARIAKDQIKLTAGMKLLVDFLKPRLINVGIDLSGCDVGMSQHFLHLTQVSAAS